MRGVTEENRPGRVARAIPPLAAYARQAQARLDALHDGATIDVAARH